jgi:hypothetical protein
MLEFIKLPLEERDAYIGEAASRRGLRPLIIEKDFWVCLILNRIFSWNDLKDKFVLKGGTSLSKVFKLTQRFSEDIDLSVDPNWLGFGGDNRPDKAPSRRQFITRCKALEEECIRAIEEETYSTLEQAISQILGPKNIENWQLSFEVDTDTHSPVLLFNYPSSEKDISAIIRPQVKLEFGSLYDQTPIVTHEASPWVAEEFPELFRSPQFSVISIAPERTFWEKATILHAEHHKPEEKKMRKNLSRDIYDICILASDEVGNRALKDFSLLQKVVEFKMDYFTSGWARYEEAKPGTFQLLPKESRIPDLKADYRRMQEMFFETQPPFEELLARLKTIQDTINSSPNNNE